jgi:hypothetical protein
LHSSRNELVSIFHEWFPSTPGSRLAFFFSPPGAASNSRKALLIPPSFRNLYCTFKGNVNIGVVREF